MSDVNQSPIESERNEYSGARVLAVFATLMAGVMTGLIGYALVDIQCTGSCGPPKIAGAFVGALFGALGVGIVATLILRAQTEWRQKYMPDGPS